MYICVYMYISYILLLCCGAAGFGAGPGGGAAIEAPLVIACVQHGAEEVNICIYMYIFTYISSYNASSDISSGLAAAKSSSNALA